LLEQSNGASYVTVVGTLSAVRPAAVGTRREQVTERVELQSVLGTIFGNCPKMQDGLAQDSECMVVDTGVYGCVFMAST
ncbi:hypothetical protein L917_01653, partial [Phytophthora nicotianae]